MSGLRTLVVGSLLLTAACGSASTPEAEPADGIVDREGTRTTEQDSDREGTRTTEQDSEREDDTERGDDDEGTSEFAEAPGIVAGDLLFGPAGDASTSILPRWYLEDPLVDPATDGVAVADDDVVTYASPDGRYVLLRRDPTAVVWGSYEVVDVRSGDVVSDFEHEGLQAAARVWWSPDGAAVVVADEIASYLHRVDGQTTVITAGSGQGGGFSNDESSTALAHCDDGSLVVATAGDAAAGVVEEQPHGGFARCWVTEVSDQDGDSVALVWYGPRSEEGDLEDGRLYRLAPDGELIETSQPGEDLAVPSRRSSSQACNDLVMVPSDGDTLGWVYSPEQDAFVSFEGSFAPTCAIPSPDGTAFAVVSQDDEPVLVGDFAIGSAIEVSRRGNPIAWSSDSSQVLVEGNGTFVVDADGSDSSEASEQLAELGPSGAYCRAGDTGLVLISEADSSGDRRRLVLFDVGANESTRLPTPTEHLREHCSVTPDGRWLLASPLLVDLENHDATELPFVVADTGARVDDSDDPVRSLDRFMWYGRQHLTDVGH